MRSSSVRLLAYLWPVAGLTALSPAALAQQPIELPGITVQGATLEAPRSSTSGEPGSSGEAMAGSESTVDTGEVGGVPAYTVGNAVTVITGAELRAQQVRQVGDALRSLPGISVSRSGGSGNLTDVRIRGAETNHTLVLIDGVEANTPINGNFDFSDLSADNIERIEVIRGPLSGIYGSNAVGGVINIVTRKGQGPLALTLQTEVGSLATKDASARLAGGNDRANLSLAYHWRETNGFNIAPQGNEDDGMRLGAFSLRGGVKILENVNVDVTLRHIDKRAERDGFGDPTAPFGSVAASFDEASALRDKIFLAGTTVRWDTLDGKLTHEFRATHNDTSLDDRSPFFKTSNVSASDTLAYLATYRLDTPAIWGKHNLTALIETGDERFTPKGDLTDGVERGRERMSYAAEWRGAFANALFLTAGVRHDDNNVFDDFTTWRAAASLKVPASGWRPHASVGTAVKAPTMFEQFGSIPQFFTPNPGLKPEESLGWDAGVEYAFAGGRTVLDVTYFSARLENKIDGFFFLPNGTFTAVNVPGISTREGVEFAGRFKLLPSIALGLSYTYLDAREPDGSREQRRPPRTARADIDYSFAGGRGMARLSTVYNGEIIDKAPYEIGTFINRPQTVGAYWVVNAAASYKLQPGVELFARVENLFDARYQEVYGYEAAPITAFAGVKLTLGGKDGIGGSGGRAK
jgi:vitamin B12 transporter